MLTSLQIKNFKAWKDTGKIRLAPLTLFFGPNSSGKSSLNQFLLMLKQTAQSPDRQRVLHPGDRTTAVDLGTYDDMTCARSNNKRIEFLLAWTLDKPLDLRNVLLKGKKYFGDRLEFHAEVGPAGGNGRQDVVVWQMDYQLGDPDDNGLQVLMKRKVNGNGKKDTYELDSKNYGLVRKTGRLWPLPSPTRFYGFPEEAIAYYQNADLVSDLTLALERKLQNIHYLGPLRQYPQRSYTWSGEIPEHVGWRGERAVDAILSARGRKINLGKKQRPKPFDELIAYWLKKLGLIKSFEVKQIFDRRDYEILVRPHGTNEPVNITDVGFGISQVLPVLVECFYCQPASTLILEQPEIHLHPAVQSALADLLISAVTCGEDGKDRNIQLLVESHSEHFLRRLQRRIAEEAISPDMVAIYFCESTGQGSILNALDLDIFGNITNWPRDFFGDEVEDLAKMTEAAMKRQQNVRSE